MELTEATEIKEITTARAIPEYENMIEDLRSIVVKTENDARLIVIEGYHELGTQMIKYGLNKPEFLTQVAQDLGKSKRTIYRVLQFVEMFPDLSQLPDGLDISWHKICNKYLIGKTENEEEFSVPQDELTAYIFENSNYIASKAFFTKSGVTIRISREQLEKYMEERK